MQTASIFIASYGNNLNVSQLLGMLSSTFKKKTENNLAMAKKTSAAAGLGHLFKQKMLSRVRRKRLNIPPGLLAAGVKMV